MIVTEPALSHVGFVDVGRAFKTSIYTYISIVPSMLMVTG